LARASSICTTKFFLKILRRILCGREHIAFPRRVIKYVLGRMNIHHTRSRRGFNSFNRISFRLRLNPKCRLPTPPIRNSSVARLNPLSVIKFYDKLSQRVTWEYYGRVRYVTGARRSSLDPTRVSSCCSARTNRVSFRRTKLSSRTSSTKRYRRLL